MTALARTSLPRTDLRSVDIRKLLKPGAFTHPVWDLALRETLISWVVLTGAFAYKIKKPVKLDFLDFSTPARRRHFCEEELRLNRRLAAELYLDVVPIVASRDGYRVGGNGKPVDYAVRMRQFNSNDELTSLLKAGQVDAEDMRSLAARLAAFHQSAPRTHRSDAPLSRRVSETAMGNVAQLLDRCPQPQLKRSIEQLADWIKDRTETLAECFLSRANAGFIRECHGDLHAGNIVRIAGRLVPFDCLEFDPDLRWIDIIDDVAFLFMDLSSHGRDDLAFVLLSHYLESTGDYAALPLLRFYLVHRALVRAKVDAITATTVGADTFQHSARLQRRIDTALRWSTQARQRTLVLMHGVSGSGKSWVSAHLIAQLHALRIRSDVERKRLADCDQPVGADLYSPRANQRTYEQLLKGATHCLRGGFDVIVDSASLDASCREAFKQLAETLGARYFIVSCDADVETLRRRVQARAREHTDPSDADLAVLDSQLRRLSAFTPDEEAHVVRIRTTDPGAVALATTAIGTVT